jgi:hypothetical protein
MKLKMSSIEIGDRILIRWLKDDLEPLLVPRAWDLFSTCNSSAARQEMSFL